MQNLTKIIKSGNFSFTAWMNVWTYVKKEYCSPSHGVSRVVNCILPVTTRFNYFNNSNRQFHTSHTFYEETAVEATETGESESMPAIDPRKDRTKIIPVELSLRYMNSAAYKTTYGDEPVWVKYVRNFKGQFIPYKTRRSCVKKGMIATGSPCPICRDEYLVLDYRNVDLLKQFISPHTGEIYDSKIIHVCQKKIFELEVALRKAKLYGYITYEVPFRSYDYKDYYPNFKK